MVSLVSRTLQNSRYQAPEEVAAIFDISGNKPAEQTKKHITCILN